jgi:hypothetical protein
MGIPTDISHSVYALNCINAVCEQTSRQNRNDKYIFEKCSREIRTVGQTGKFKWPSQCSDASCGRRQKGNLRREAWREPESECHLPARRFANVPAAASKHALDARPIRCFA